MIVSLLLSLAGIGILASLIIKLAVYALPSAVGLMVGLAAFHAGNGPTGSAVVGTGAGALLFALRTVVAGSTRSPLLRALIAVIFAIPAALAGYSLAYHLSGIDGSVEWWRELVAVVGAAVFGGAAWSRVSAPRLGGPERESPSTHATTGLRTDGYS